MNVIMVERTRLKAASFNIRAILTEVKLTLTFEMCLIIQTRC